MELFKNLETMGKKARTASHALAQVSKDKKNQILLTMAEILILKKQDILTANAQDIAREIKNQLPEPLLDRLRLDSPRIESMAEGLRQMAKLSDPVGETLLEWERPNGLHISKIRVPLGVVGMIYESRPNVTVDTAGLCLKTGNACILRGGSEAFSSNKVLVDCLRQALLSEKVDVNAIQLVETTDRDAVKYLLRMNQYLDVVIPRGGAGLIQMVMQNSTVPVIETGTGVCHTFVDESADLDMAQAICINAKTSRPGVCNAMETLLIHEQIAPLFLPRLLEAYAKLGVEIRGCERTTAISPQVKPAIQEDWSTEYMALILSVKIVASIEEAITHINLYGTHHSEAIITEKTDHKTKFLKEVDAAAVYHNASTRFTDGFEFGFGAEIGISTQKLHVRGPMGLESLTSMKYMVCGNGQIR